jgi:hypothetical protein
MEDVDTPRVPVADRLIVAPLSQNRTRFLRYRDVPMLQNQVRGLAVRMSLVPPGFLVE